MLILRKIDKTKSLAKQYFIIQMKQIHIFSSWAKQRVYGMCSKMSNKTNPRPYKATSPIMHTSGAVVGPLTLHPAKSILYMF